MQGLLRDSFHWDKEFTRRLIRIALPMALQNLVSASLHIVDGIMISSLSTQHYAAATQAGKYSFLFQLFMFGAASGSAIYISQFWGKRDVAGIRGVMGLCFRIVCGLAILFAGAAMLFPGQIMSLFLQEGFSRELAKEYLFYVAPSYLIMAVDTVYQNAARSTERPVIPMLAGVVAIICNTIFNYILINGKLGFPALGIKGAAIATVAAAGVSLLINVSVTYAKRLPGAAKLHELRMPDKRFVKEYIKRVLPVVANEGMWSLGISVYSMFYGVLGDDAVAAVGVYNNIDQLMTVLIFGVVNATAIMVGKAIGAEDRDGAFLIAKRMLVCVVCLSVVTGLVMILLRAPILSVYSGLSALATQKAMLILLIAGAAMWIRHINTVMIVGILRAGGDTVYSMFLDAGMVWIVGVPLVAVCALWLKLPIEVCFAATLAEEIVKAALSMPRFFSRKWIHNVTI